MYSKSRAHCTVVLIDKSNLSCEGATYALWVLRISLLRQYCNMWILITHWTRFTQPNGYDFRCVTVTLFLAAATSSLLFSYQRCKDSPVNFVGCFSRENATYWSIVMARFAHCSIRMGAWSTVRWIEQSLLDRPFLRQARKDFDECTFENEYSTRYKNESTRSYVHVPK